MRLAIFSTLQPNGGALEIFGSLSSARHCCPSLLGACFHGPFDLDEVELDLQATTEGLKEAVRVCEGDIQKLCGSTQPGEGRIAACLAANRSSVSVGCVDAVGKLNIK
jgi:hypothetical protein